ncbi:MAG: GEVED domain-containing protein [Bacteroidota bacterium]
MKKITLLLFALLFSWQFSAQTIVIGTGTGTTTSTGNDPIDGYYNSFRYQVVYTAAELSAMLTPYDEITSLGFSIAGDYGGGNLLGYTIKMGHTTATNSAAHDASTTTTVKFPFSYNPTVTAAGAFDMITLDSNFIWNGVDNVLIDICSSGSNPFTSPYGQVRTNTLANGSRFYRVDSANACGVNTNSTNGDRPNIQFNYIDGTPPSCLPTSLLAADNITANGVETSWNDESGNGAVGYEYAITTSATPPASGTQTTDNFYIQPTGLSPQTVYFLHVRVECAGSTYSSWSTISFTTTCATVSSFSENFNSVTTPALPSCWSKILSGGTISTFATVNTGTTNASAPYGVELYNSGSGASDNIMLVSPLLDNLSAGTHRLKFNARNSTATQDLQIGVLTNPADASTFTLVQSVDITTAFQNYVVNFDTFTGPGAAIAIRRLSTSTFTYVYLDDIVWEVLPTCPDQTGLAVANITATGVETSWFDTGAIGYEYAITTSATPPASGTQTTDTFYIQPTGLAPQTVHYLHVRSECAGSTYGTWSTLSFTTACVPLVTLPWNEGFESVAVGTNIFPQCWGYTNTTSVWNIETFPVANTGVNSLGRTWSTDGWAYTPTFTLTGGTSYRFSYFIRTQDATVGYDVTVGVGNSQSAAAMTTTLSSVTGYQNPTWTKVMYEFTPSISGDYSFGVHVVAPSAPNGINFDDFRLELTPTCPDQTGLAVANITANGVETSWFDTGAIGYEYAITTSATPPASGTQTTDTFYIQPTGLTPQTVYYLHVRSECAGSTYGTWSTLSFTTACVAITTLPHTEGFDAVATPSCWTTALITGTTNWAPDTASDGVPGPRTGARFAGKSWVGNDDALLISPSYNLAAYPTNQTRINVWIYRNTVGLATDKVTFYANTTTNLSGATQLLDISLPITSAPTVASAGWYNYTVNVPLSFNTGGDFYIIAQGRTTSSFASYSVGFDDYALELSPTIPPACATNLVATPNATCGNFSSNLTWDAAATASGYYVTIGTTTGGNDIANAVDVSGTSYSFTGSLATTYFWTVVPYSTAGSATGCTEQSFSTVATGCYCVSVPSSNDNLGITSAIVGATTNPIADVTYVDLTASPEVISQGANTNVQLTFSTGFTYDINIWIDFNNDFDFDDAGELVKTGIACTAAQPNTVDASFTMPLTAPVGLHRMRIGTADDGQVPPDTCYNGSYGVTLDFTIDTALLSANSFDKSNFVAYPNPVKDVLNLSYNTAISNVNVVNLLGQQVLNSKTNSNDVQVDMSALTAGAYIVNITVDNTIHTIKVIKQ